MGAQYTPEQTKHYTMYNNRLCLCSLEEMKGKVIPVLHCLIKHDAMKM
jgi:hypothetical protein